jgi:very-short-patch-repair endonuclease
VVSLTPMPGIHNRKTLKGFRKDLRNNCTTAEALLWQHLKHSQLGKKIRRQHSVGKYILDFYCATERVAIELDGAHHYTEQGIQYDAKRTAYLNCLNIKVIRFKNARVWEDLDGMLREIRIALDSG